MNIFLIRHTKVDLKESTCYGISDVPLASSFENEVKFVKKHLANIKNVVYYSSPSHRCLKLVNQLTKDQPIVDARLCEMNFGDWEMIPWKDLEKIKAFRNWADNFVEVQTPNGESYLQLYARSVEFWEKISKETQKNIVVIAHGGSIRSILAYLNKIHLKDSFKFQIDFHSITKIEVQKDSEGKIDYKIAYTNKIT
ncbi:2,3-bisphosphoglycerate-dependent phosphoglycerate mutase [Candidatus Lokiarchaeum ossiferum]|uniref:2,3-bisphosphoglycerate-dependent phosphoglycerate mutase n=1 Tax=Candidatus Lokiarchaeum ossiferum TaxID=2951803 RepID=A0ABY6I1K9_9ARCH|nr:2,3-bisphosphoglycerate-dependent phosphoglycerate mutase [Candidatus Lokiarchaeum sp. B-35]